MLTMVVNELGGPDVFEPREAESPEAGPGHVVVDHEHIGVNFVDAQHRAGTPYPVEVPLIVGIEAAGVVVDVGDGVDRVDRGDRVAYGGVMAGVYAQRAVVPADQVVPLQPDITSETAAASLLQGWTAHMLTEYLTLVRRAPWAEPDQTVTAVVFAAAGGTGSLLVQMLVAAGVRVLGIASGSDKAAVVTSLGAECIDRRIADPVRGVHAAVDGGADIVFEGIGGNAFDQARLMLRPRGHLVSFGQAAGVAPPIDPAILSGISGADGSGSLSLSWPTLNDHNATSQRRRARADAVFALIRDGSLVPQIDEILPLTEAAEAHRRLEAGTTIGKLLLDPTR